MLALDRETFVERLRDVGTHKYHDKHPFHVAMHEGTLEPPDIRAWICNRYYYQKCIPIKDAAILSHLPSREMRRVWIKRIVDHDGAAAGEGGLEQWIALSRAVGLSVDDVLSERRVHAATRFAVDAYVTFARTQPWILAVAASLTELFAPDLMTRRVEVLAEKYPWIDRAGLAYFRSRIDIAARDADYALTWVCDHATTVQLQDECVRALSFKCDVLWAVLDATQLAARAARL